MFENPKPEPVCLLSVRVDLDPFKQFKNAADIFCGSRLVVEAFSVSFIHCAGTVAIQSKCFQGRRLTLFQVDEIQCAGDHCALYRSALRIICVTGCSGLRILRRCAVSTRCIAVSAAASGGVCLLTAGCERKDQQCRENQCSQLFHDSFSSFLFS